MGGRLLGLCQRIASGNRADADDAFQEVALAIFDALPGFRGDAKLSTWCYRITVRVAIRSLRRRRSQRADVTRTPDPVDPRPTSVPEVAVTDREQLTRIRTAIDALPLTYRLPLALNVFDGRSGAEIADVLGLSIETVWTRLHRARKRLAELLGRLENDASAREGAGRGAAPADAVGDRRRG